MSDTSIYDIAFAKPDTWIREDECTTDEQRWDLCETGGMLQYCSCCETFNSPNRPCFCGAIVLRHPSTGLFWGGENGWVSDWKYAAEHFFSLDSAAEVAQALVDDVGHIQACPIQTNWQEKKPLATF